VMNLPMVPEFTERLHFRLADGIFVVSDVLKKYYTERYVPETKMTVIHNGVDVERFNQGIENGHVGHQERKGPVIGFVGSFHYWHGIKELSEIMTHILNGYPQVSFLLVGDGPMIPELKRQFSGPDVRERVQFAGYVEHQEVPRYVATMDIMLALYPKLDFFYYSPLKLFEYMAAGKPVVATGMGQIKQVIEDGKNGFIFAPGSMTECVEKTVQLIENTPLRKRLGRAARETMVNEYTWYRAAQKIDALIASVR
jgi:glycosyltransferase involved in cell wall biosynthesis